MVLRHGIVAKTPEVVLSGDVEFDELYVVAGHKGNPEAVRAKGPAQQIEGDPRSRHLGEGKAADLRHDRARSGDPDACPASHPIIEKPKARPSILTSIASTPGFLVSATATRPSVMVEANTPGTRTVMGSARSTPSRASGRSCDPGCIAASRRRSCRSISASSSSFTMLADGERLCSAP
jgi:hypothetical protein